MSHEALWIRRGVGSSVLAVACGATVLSATIATHATAPPGRYTITGGMVRDTLTKLTWQQTASSQRFPWANANSYCLGLNLNGTGWRIPTMRELATIVDIHQIALMIDGTAFPGTQADWYWSSTPAVLASNAWAVDFYSAGTGYFPMSTSYLVRCVR
jgi:hypothetical protein